MDEKTRPIFRPGYYFAGEVHFNQALKEKRLEEALEILEKFPYGNNIEEETLRAATLVQGYRALARVLLNENTLQRNEIQEKEDSDLEEKYKRTKKDLDTLQETYDLKLKKISELEARIKELTNSRKMRLLL